MMILSSLLNISSPVSKRNVGLCMLLMLSTTMLSIHNGVQGQELSLPADPLDMQMDQIMTEPFMGYSYEDDEKVRKKIMCG